MITFRKFLSLLLSILFFANPFSTQHWSGATAVFGGIVWYSAGSVWQGGEEKKIGGGGGEGKGEQEKEGGEKDIQLHQKNGKTKNGVSTYSPSSSSPSTLSTSATFHFPSSRSPPPSSTSDSPTDTIRTSGRRRRVSTRVE